MGKFIVMFLTLVCLFAGITTGFANECGPVGTGTPGYWMNHPEAWPVEEITVGGTVFTKGAAIVLMKSPVKGDKSFTMFSAFVAAQLNVLIGNCPPDCYSLSDVNYWLRKFPVGTNVKASSEAWQYSHGEALYWCLDSYNNGMIDGIPSRDTFD